MACGGWHTRWPSRSASSSADVPTTAPRALLLSIGSELLLGETVDTNAAFLGRELAAAGVELLGTRTVPDDRALIAAAFREAITGADLVLATGGLGPTHDDLTREGLADALGEQLTADSGLEAMLRERFAAYGRMPSSNLRQALRIPSAEAVANPIGSAPGWWVRAQGARVALMPGVPSEMRQMWHDELAPRVRDAFRTQPLAMRTVKTFGIGESAAAELVGDLLEHPGPGITTGIYARDDGVHIRFSTREDAAVLDQPAREVARLLEPHVWGLDSDELAAVALSALGRAGVRTVASWESDTDGALLAILAGAAMVDGAARFVGGMLDGGAPLPVPVADLVLQLSLLAQDRRGRSRVKVSASGTRPMPITELRIHGSGPQRQRRAAFAACDELRRRSAGTPP